MQLEDLNQYTYDRAIYTPALESGWFNFFDKDIVDLRPNPFTHSLDDIQRLNFLSDEGYWKYDYALYTAGHSHKIPNSLRNRRKGSILITDSGGYQLYTQSGLWSNINLMSQDMWDMITATQNFQEEVGDYAMTLDAPLQQIVSEKPLFSTYEECLAFSVETLHLYNKNRKDKTRYVNVIHGSSPREVRKWIDSVKWFPASGWAIAGFAGASLSAIIYTIRYLKDQGLLEDANIIHLLGKGTPDISVVASFIGRNIEKRITFDSSSEISHMRFRGQLPITISVDTTESQWSRGKKHWLKTDKLEYNDVVRYINQLPKDMCFPDAWSPTMRQIKIGDLRADNNAFDNLTNYIFANHNIFCKLEAMFVANDQAEQLYKSQHPDYPFEVRHLPKERLEDLLAIGEACVVDNWETHIEENHERLDAIYSSKLNFNWADK